MSEELKAGRNLDEVVACNVMRILAVDWRSVCYVEKHSMDDYEYDSQAPRGERESGWCYTCQSSVRDAVKAAPHFSRDIGAAWRVVEKTNARRLGAYWFYEIGFIPEVGWKARIMALPLDDDECSAECKGWALADTAPLAICKAALAAHPYVEDEADESLKSEGAA